MISKISENLDKWNSRQFITTLNDDNISQNKKSDNLKKFPKEISSIVGDSKIQTSKTESSLLFENSVIFKILSKFDSKLVVEFVKPSRIKIRVDPANIIEIAKFLNHELGFDHAESVTGTDYPKDNQIEVIYHLGSYLRDDLAHLVLSLTTRTDRDEARLPSLLPVYGSVEYHEREIFEMLGVYFDGHPRNERFLLPEDWADIPPLRKEFHIKGR